MKHALIFLLLFIITSSIQAQTTPAAQPTMPSGQSLKSANITYKLLPAAGKTFGYDIYVNGTLTIHQPTVPGVSGNEGFKSQAAATRIAEMVITKMKEGKMPPTVTPEEMKKMKAL
jgi:hypothetical protein